MEVTEYEPKGRVAAVCQAGRYFPFVIGQLGNCGRRNTVFPLSRSAVTLKNPESVGHAIPFVPILPKKCHRGACGKTSWKGCNPRTSWMMVDNVELSKNVFIIIFPDELL
jgi:hypothetical protein